MCKILIPPELSQHCEGRSSIDCGGAESIAAICATLMTDHPTLSQHLFGGDGTGGGWIFAINGRLLTAADRLKKEDSVTCLKVLYGG